MKEYRAKGKILAKELQAGETVFTTIGMMTAKEGDYLVSMVNDPNNVWVLDKERFERDFEPVDGEVTTETLLPAMNGSEKAH